MKYSLVIVFILMQGCTFKNSNNRSHVKYDVKFQTDYQQFYMGDKNSTDNTEDRDFWSDHAFEERLAVRPGMVGVRTAGGLRLIRLKLMLLDSALSNMSLDKYDHIVEGGITVTSGQVQILDCPNSSVALEFFIKPGQYRIRVYSSGLDTEYDKNPKDSYTIEMWPDGSMERRVLKQYVYPGGL